MVDIIRTDLALEIQEDLQDYELQGIKVSTNINADNEIKETQIDIMTEEGAKLLGKPIGKYITLESEKLQEQDEDYHIPMCNALKRHLKQMVGERRKLLIAGLGNRAVTPDALGPLVVDQLFVTRHLIRSQILGIPYEISAIAPGVMGQTGMESQEVLLALIKEMKPDILIVIDALAAKNSNRLNKTIQISNTGLAPGSGVGNHRLPITSETMGVDVIAIGVPTVISVPAIIDGVMDVMLEAFGKNGMKEAMEEFTDNERYQLATEMVEPYLAKMFVTPKNIDEAVKRISYTISEAINGMIEIYSC